MTALAEIVGERRGVTVVGHAAVAPTGVWVVQACDAVGRVKVRRPLGGARRLTVGGHDQSDLVAAVARRVRAVQDALGEDVPVHGVLCFTRANRPLLRTVRLDGYPLLSPKGLAVRLDAEGPLDGDRRDAIAARLRERLP